MVVWQSGIFLILELWEYLNTVMHNGKIFHFKFQLIVSLNCIQDFWNYFSSFFGIDHIDDNNKSDYNGFKIISFICLIMGSIVWISYGAFLTSALAVPLQKLPFNDLETLILSDFKLNTLTRYNGITGYFLQAPAGSIQNRVAESKFTDKSFNTAEESVSKVLNSNKEAFFGSIEFIESNPKLQCQLTMVWKTPMRLWGRSFGLQKGLISNIFPCNQSEISIFVFIGSKYKEFMEFLLMEMHENGAIDILERRHTGFQPNCKEFTNPTLTIKKVIIPFMIVSIGSGTSMLFCCFEKVMKKI